MFVRLGNMLRAFKMWLVHALYGINVICSLVKTCVAGIERHPYTKYGRPLTDLHKKLYQQIQRLTLIAIGYLDLKYLPPPYLKL